MPCLCQGLCGAAFGAPGPGDHKGEYLETDFVVINHEVRQVFGQVLEGGDLWTDPSWRVFFFFGKYMSMAKISHWYGPIADKFTG